MDQHASSSPLANASTQGPGLSTRMLQHVSHLDFGDVRHYLFTIGTTITALSVAYYSLRRTADNLFDLVTSTVEVRSHDDAYACLMHWMGLQKNLIHTTSWVASIQVSSQKMFNLIRGSQAFVPTQEDNDDDLALAAHNFDEYWTERIHRDRSEPVVYTPREGLHWFRYKGHFITFNRVIFPATATRVRPEVISLTCLGREATILKELLMEAQKSSIVQEGSHIAIYRSGNQRGYGEWERRGTRIARPLSTVVLNEAEKQVLINDIREYLHPLTKRWYADRGIPYRRGYLLSGPPGTGKTSLCLALAGMFSLPVYITSLNSHVSEDSLSNMFSELPTRSIMLLEDIDAAGLSVGSRTTEPTAGSNSGHGTPAKEPSVSLSALLNAIDGIVSVEGRILLMTTNHIEHLDPALIRPGRIDHIVRFQDATTEMAKQMFLSFYAIKDIERSKSQSIQDYVKRKLSSCDYPSSEQELVGMAVSFASKIPSEEFSPAQLQGYMLMHKYRPDKAITNLPAWVKYERDAKAKKEQEQVMPQSQGTAAATVPDEKLVEDVETASAAETRTPRRSARGRSKSVRAKSRKRA
ncbi:hypothetical protein LTR70_005352 [Exophiala xenobiotica]|uniref:Uncharacterized protein n=1 Tax=Lithohypha guttulata TaxID=1690604 RepID=A0ABR0K5A9_9EURO|nr:hypothetical protein LTR24_006682 [Lithohypha guttulata]KAK5318787.1 hypothetical protein LTR70_005352 [Exophiala xenobiotica]